MVEENRVVYARRKSFGLWEAMWVLHCASWPFTLIPYISMAFPSDKTIQQGFPTFSFSFLLTKFILRKGPKLWCNGIKRHCMPAYMYPFLHDKSKVNQTSIIYYCSNSYHMLTLHISFSNNKLFSNKLLLKN